MEGEVEICYVILSELSEARPMYQENMRLKLSRWWLMDARIARLPEKLDARLSETASLFQFLTQALPHVPRVGRWD